MAKHKRRIKLVDPKLQIQLTMIFVGLSALGIVMQFILFQSTMSELSSQLPHDGSRLMEAVNGVLPGVLGITLLAIMPLTYIVGVLTTFRIAGPVHRMKMYLRDVEEHGFQKPLRLRRGDKLVELAEQLSHTVEKLAAQAAAEDSSHSTATDEQDGARASEASDRHAGSEAA